MKKNTPDDGLDITGIGKLAKAIPATVYERTTATICSTFEKLVAPLTETTAGFGYYVRQKFENMVAVEKALATYSLEKAFQKAEQNNLPTHSPVHPKSFILAIENASKETNLFMHDLWVNLLSSQITDDTCHPHFVEVLSHLSPLEALLLTELVTIDNINSDNSYLSYERDRFKYWIRTNNDRDYKKWTYSCSLLIELGLAAVMAITDKNITYKKEIPSQTTILYLTHSGETFLRIVNHNTLR